MPNFNRIIVSGHLGKDPEIRYTAQGTGICSFTIAVSERYKDGGEWKDRPIWFKVKVWGKRAEIVSQSLAKGSSCLVEGRISIETWKNKDGKEVTTMVIDGADVTFLEKRPGVQTDRSERPRASTAPVKESVPEISDDDIPF